MTLDEMLVRCLEEIPEADLSDFVGKANAIQDEICRYKTGKWSWLLTTAQIVTVATYQDGKVDVDEGSTTVSGTDTAWTSDMEGRKLRFTGKPSIYVVDEVAGPTELSLDREFEHADVEEGAYSIYQDVYELPSDFRSVLAAIDLRTDRKLYMVNHGGYLDLHRGGFPRDVCGRLRATVEGDYLRMVDIPVDPTTIELWYYKRLSAMADITAEPGLPAHMHELLLDGLLADYMGRYMGDAGSAHRRYGEQRAKYQRSLRDEWLSDQARNNPPVGLKRTMF